MFTRFSQQPTQTAAPLPAEQFSPQPHDITVPDETQHSLLSNTRSPSSGSADNAMCPSVCHVAGDGYTGNGVPAGSGASLEVSLRELAAAQTEQFTILTNSIAGIQRQFRELTDITSPTTEWTRSQQARSVDVDKTLESLRASMDALQSAPVSSVETKSVVSDWPLPKVAGSTGSGSNRRPSQSHTPGESVGFSQLPGKRQKPSFSPAQKAPEEWYQQDDALCLSSSLVVRTKTLSKSFVLLEDPCEIWCNKGSENARLIFHSKTACQQFLTANSGTEFLYTAENPLAVRKSADVFVRQARAFDERQMEKRLALLWNAANKLTTSHIQYTP